MIFDTMGFFYEGNKFFDIGNSNLKEIFDHDHYKFHLYEIYSPKKIL
jgi:hypothetical protein